MSLISIFKTPIIEFLTTEQHLDVLAHPAPANKFIPEWYKDLSTHIAGKRDIKGSPVMTAKKCLPMLDILTYGFILPLGGDIHVRTNKDASMIDITENQYVKLTEEHSQDQVGPKFPYKKHHLVKFINSFVIKTAPGYSCMFIPPVNHIETRFIALGGIVETDLYDREINFPSLWLATDYDDIVAAGTPIVQCIPFKRSNTIKKYNVRKFTEQEFKKREITRMRQDNQNSYYVNNLRVKK
jgi:hypothetical protein